MNLNDDNIGKFFQESLKDMEVQPDKAVWSAIEKRADISMGMSVLAKVGVVFILAAVVVTAYVFMQNSAKVQPQFTEMPIAIENPVNSIEVIESASEIQSPVLLDTIKQEPIVEKPKKNKVKKAKLEPKAKKNKSVAMLKLTEAKKVAPLDEDAKKTEKSDENKQRLTPEQELYQAHLIDFSEKDTNEAVDTASHNEELVQSRDADTAHITFSKNPTICFGEDALLRVIGGRFYDWSTGATTASLKVSPVEQSDYWVIVRDEFGNEIKHTFTVYIDRECTSVYAPSAFTPNGDGMNDKFKAEGVGIQSFKMVIFNREGQIVFESSNIDDAWDGTYRNAIQQSQVFFYRIQYVDAKGNTQNKQGQVTLIR